VCSCQACLVVCGESTTIGEYRRRMGDEDLRELERAWRASKDGELATRFVAALRRSGRPAPEEALLGRLLPARELRSRIAIEVSATLADGSYVELGSTADGRVIELPAHRSWSASVSGALVGAELVLLVQDIVALQVEQLSLLDTDEVTDLGYLLGMLRSGCVPITHLGLPILRPVSAATLAAVVGLPWLVSLSCCVRDGFEQLGQAGALETLMLHVEDDVNDDRLGPLELPPSLRALHVDGPLLDGTFLDGLAPSSSLRTFDLRRSGRLDAGVLERLARHRSLTRISLPSDEGGSQKLSALAGLSLEALDVPGAPLDADGLAALDGMPLTRLSVGRIEVEGRLPAGLHHLALGGGAPSVLTGLHGLEGLSLREVTQGWIQGIAELPGLERLTLGARTVGPQPSPDLDLRPLVGCRLVHLLLHDLRLSGAGPEVFEGSETLRFVTLTRGEWTDAHLGALSRCPRLEQVHLHRTDDVADVALESLARCKFLRTLELFFVKLSRDAVRRFQTRRPDVAVEAHGLPRRPG
jgi:hypothetical protein